MSYHIPKSNSEDKLAWVGQAAGVTGKPAEPYKAPRTSFFGTYATQPTNAALPTASAQIPTTARAAAKKNPYAPVNVSLKPPVDPEKLPVWTKPKEKDTIEVGADGVKFDTSVPDWVPPQFLRGYLGRDINWRGANAASRMANSNTFDGQVFRKQVEMLGKMKKDPRFKGMDEDTLVRMISDSAHAYKKGVRGYVNSSAAKKLTSQQLLAGVKDVKSRINYNGLIRSATDPNTGYVGTLISQFGDKTPKLKKVYEDMGPEQFHKFMTRPDIIHFANKGGPTVFDAARSSEFWKGGFKSQQAQEFNQYAPKFKGIGEELQALFAAPETTGDKELAKKQQWPAIKFAFVARTPSNTNAGPQQQPVTENKADQSNAMSASNATGNQAPPPVIPKQNPFAGSQALANFFQMGAPAIA